MSKTQSISVIVPAYNEEKKLPSSIHVINNYLTKLSCKNFEILIIENGSNDNTADIAKKLAVEYENVKAISLRTPSYGEAYRYGILHTDCDMVTIYPVDLAFSLNFIGRSYALIDKFPIIFGVRFHQDSNVDRPLIRVLISKIHTILVNIFLGTHYNDVDCLKAYRTDIGKKLVKSTTAKDPFIEVELAYLIKKANISYHEIPINHIEKEIARHPLYLVRTILKNFINLFRYKLIVVKKIN